MRGKLLPGTLLGKWSAGFIIIFILFDAIGTIISFVQKPTASNNFVVSIFVILGLFAGIGAFITGMTSIIKHKERSIIVFIISIIGSILVIFIIGELMFSH